MQRKELGFGIPSSKSDSITSASGLIPLVPSFLKPQPRTVVIHHNISVCKCLVQVPDVLNNCLFFISSTVSPCRVTRRGWGFLTTKLKDGVHQAGKQLGSWSESKGGFRGGRDKRLNYADYSFVPCSLHLPWCLLGYVQRQTHTICTPMHKSTHVQTCTQL
jgi:hypothetical protein